jgi:hypothetical protein
MRDEEVEAGRFKEGREGKYAFKFGDPTWDPTPKDRS